MAAVAAFSLSGLAAPAALAAPAVDATEVAAASSEVDRVSALVAAAEEELARATVTAEAAADADRVAQDQLAAAQVAAATAAAQLQTAQAATVVAEADIATLGREAFMGVQTLGDAEVLLGSEGPEELLQRAATLEQLGVDRSERLEAVEAVQADQEDAAEVARDAVAAQDLAATVAVAADTAAQEQLATSQASYDQVVAERTALQAELLAAQIALLEAQGVADAAEVAAAAAEQATVTASAGTGTLVTGRVTSCYGARWGTTHYGIDIAAPIGTPIYVPEDGVVLQAGPASGFGQAVYVQHPDGVISVYGHVDTFTVRTGQTVTAGQQIATVGNRGQSTGPHVHVETHYGGLYQERRDPVAWLTARGVNVGSCT